MAGSQSRIVHRRLPQDDPKQRRPDISRAQELLDWQPRTDLKEVLIRTIAYLIGCCPTRNFVRSWLGNHLFDARGLGAVISAAWKVVNPPRRWIEAAGSGRTLAVDASHLVLVSTRMSATIILHRPLPRASLPVRRCPIAVLMGNNTLKARFYFRQ